MKLIPKHIDTLTHAVSTDETRYNLTGVYFDKTHKRAVATNGHMMAIKPLAVASDDMDSIPWGEVVKTPKKFEKGTKPFIHVNEAGINEQNPKDSVKFLGSSFPDYVQALPTKTPVMSVSFSADALLKLAKALEAGDCLSKQIVTLEIISDSEPITVRPCYAKQKEAFGVLMPCKRG